MYARISTFERTGDQIDQGVQFVQGQVIPRLRQMDGFKEAYWLLDRQGGKMIAITLWESEEALQASEQAVADLRSQAVSTGLVGREPTVERYEVIAQA